MEGHSAKHLVRGAETVKQNVRDVSLQDAGGQDGKSNVGSGWDPATEKDTKKCLKSRL